MRDARDLTGLVLAGGRGSRMGGVDKGLLPWRTTTLAGNALARLRPQVGPLMISANRHLDAYAGFGVPVWPDAEGGNFDGPLAGLLSGLRHATTPWLVVVPCDAPCFPLDLVDRLAQGVGDADAAMAAIERDGELRRQPVFCLVRTDLGDSLAAYLAGGGRKAGQWLMQHGCISVRFDDPAAFANLNTAQDLRSAADGG